MQEIISYYYQQTAVAVFAAGDQSIVQRNRIVYARELEINKGVENRLRIRVMNNEQKPVNLVGREIQFLVIDDYVRDNPRTVLTLTVVNSLTNPQTDATRGICPVTISRFDTTGLTRNQYRWALKIRNIGDQQWQAAYVDDNWGTSGQLRVNSGSFPGAPATYDLGNISDESVAAVYDLGEIR